jgi:serine/threonine protein kinase
MSSTTITTGDNDDTCYYPDRHIRDLTGTSIENGNIMLKQHLGGGSYGQVYLGIDKSERRFAIKIMKKNGDDDDDIENEIRLHRRVTIHPNIATLHRVLEDSNHYYMVMDLYEGGTVYDLICGAPDFRKDDDAIRKLFVQILDALKFCHDQSVAHRDLKPENILLSKDRQKVYLTDFGLSGEKLYSRRFRTGSPLYISPGMSINP